MFYYFRRRKIEINNISENVTLNNNKILILPYSKLRTKKSDFISHYAFMVMDLYFLQFSTVYSLLYYKAWSIIYLTVY